MWTQSTSTSYVVLLVEKQFFHPIAMLDVHQTLKDLLLYAFITPRNPTPTGKSDWLSRTTRPTRGTRPSTICEKLICKWQQGQFQMVRGPIEIYEGQQISRATKRQGDSKFQGQPSAKTGAYDRFSGRALRGLVINHYHAKITQVL